MPGLRLQLLLLCFVCADCAVLHNKGYFCRDPDSGKLHPVNTTWASTTFCGNYTCKIKKRNVTAAEDTPIRQLNVTNIDQEADKNNVVTIEKKTEPDLQQILHKNVVSDPQNLVNKETTKTIKPDPRNYNTLLKYVEEKLTTKSTTPHYIAINENKIVDESDDGDRYLTEKEINYIAELLHTVKKSDLDAVVDIYKLAQDVYTEMEISNDKETDRELVGEAINLIKDEEKYIRNKLKPASYWYDPLTNKGRMADRYADMDLQSTRVVQTTVKPKPVVSTYFNGALSGNDFGKIPYYYPVTQFQRVSSYTHSPQPINRPKLDKTEPTNIIPALPQNNKKNSNKLQIYDSQKLIQPSLLLPYPFTSIHQYNITNFPMSFYYSQNPWTLAYYNRYKYYQPYFQAYAPPKAILINPNLSNDIQDVEQKPIKIVNDKTVVDTLMEKKKKMPNWKTEPISIEVLKDIRANIDTSRLPKPFPLRKKIKLERVGKLINTDELSKQERRKRFADTSVAPEEIVTEIDEYNVILDRITCQEHTEPGYFRIGNMSRPYPDCCPQLITRR